MPENAPNITIYVSPVSTELALALAAAESIAKPARVVYVFGTADDVAPNFTTVAGAVTYARSLVPDHGEPVVIRLFTKLDGTPYDLDGGDSWIVYAFEHIYIYSDFKRLNTITDEVPTLLPAGLTIWYIDPNGVETLWVGREDGSAQLVGGCANGAFVPTFTVDGGTITTASSLSWARNANIVTISGLLSLTLTDSPFDSFSINNLPDEISPASSRQIFISAGSQNLNTPLSFYFAVVEDNQISFGVSADSIPHNVVSFFCSYII